MIPAGLVAVMEPEQVDPPTEVGEAWEKLKTESAELRNAINQIGQQTNSLSMPLPPTSSV